MFTCHVCGGTVPKFEFVSEVFTVDDRRVLVEHIPAELCQRCGEATFSRETTEKIRQLFPPLEQRY
jgi:HTH-type transcriptional regulator / antitoxin MqsA